MNFTEFARFFVRFNAATFLFWAIHSLVDLPPYIRNYQIVHEVRGADALAARDLWTFVWKILLEVFVALILFFKTDHVIALFSKGRWPAEPNQPPEPTAPSGRGSP